MELIRRFWDAAIALDPAAAERDEAVRFPLCRPGALGTLFADGGLAGVEGREIVVPTLPTKPDGSIHLTARAWAAKGHVPA